MISAKKVFEILKKECLITYGRLQHREAEEYIPAHTRVIVKSSLMRVSEETYGRESEMYFRCVSEDVARLAAKELEEAGGNPDFGWCNDNPAFFSMQISRINGWHWWE